MSDASVDYSIQRAKDLYNEAKRAGAAMEYTRSHAAEIHRSPIDWGLFARETATSVGEGILLVFAVGAVIAAAPEIAGTVVVGTLVYWGVQSIRSIVEHHDEAKRAGVVGPEMEVIAGLLDPIGGKDFLEGLSGQKMLTDQWLSSTDRTNRLAHGTGGLITVMVGGKVLKIAGRVSRLPDGRLTVAGRYIRDKVETVHYLPREIPTTLLPAGEGETDRYGNITYSTLGTAEDQALALHHERSHSFLTPKFKLPQFIYEWRLQSNKWARENIQLVKYLEEIISEAYARFRVHGLSQAGQDIHTSFTFAFKVPRYQLNVRVVAAQGVIYGGTVIGTVIIEGVKYLILLTK